MATRAQSPDAAPLTPQRTGALRKRLLKWYADHHRKLPWRAAPGTLPDAYHVFVSEAMLQQTQVATVVDYFHRFIDAFPTVRDLAAADEQRVLRLWQGLGYYRRARNLHAAARAIVEHHAGRVPDTVEQLLALPGVGRYTAGAIASIGHGRPAPIVDGNVARVLARLLPIDEPTTTPAAQRTLWAAAETLVPADNPGDFNQAMMELGATVCTPAAPGCLLCPLATLCEARKQNRVEQLPVPTPRKAPRAVTHHVLAITRGEAEELLFVQRPAKGLWSNMWQLPTAEDLPDTPTPAALRQWAKRTLGVAVNRIKQTSDFKHQTTHRTITFVVWRCKHQSGAAPAEARWRHADCLDDLPLPNPQRRALSLLADRAAR